MHAHEPQLRDLYPDAVVDQPLRAYRPPRMGISARTWSRLVWTLGGVVFGMLAVVWVLEHTVGPETVNQWFGGDGNVRYDSDGDAQTLEGTWLLFWLYGLSAIAAVTYGLLRLSLKSPLRRERRMSWQRWAQERGFSRSSTGALGERTGMPVLSGGRGRDWTGPWSGRVGRHTVHVGATAWTTGSGKDRERHHAFFVLAELTPEAAVRFPASSVTHFLRGFSDFDVDVDGRELRLESTDVDLNCQIRVQSGTDLRWRQLFDPTMLHALAEAIDVQWHQRGRRIIFVAGGSRQRRAPVETLDTMCTGAEFVLRRFEFVADTIARGERAA